MYVSMSYPKQQSSIPPKRGKWKAIVLIVLFFFVTFILIFLKSPLSKIRSIEVVGAGDLKPERIITDSGLTQGMSIWKVHSTSAEQSILEKNPIINKADISLSFWSGKVVIALSEKKVVGLFLYKGKFYRLLSDGTIFDESTTDIPDIPILSTARNLDISVGQKLNVPEFVMIANQLATVNDSVLKQISEIRETDGRSWYKWVMYTKDKFEIRLDGKNLSDGLSKYVDFRKQLDKSGKPPGIINFWEGKGWYDSYTDGNGKSGAKTDTQ